MKMPKDIAEDLMKRFRFSEGLILAKCETRSFDASGKLRPAPPDDDVLIDIFKNLQNTLREVPVSLFEQGESV